MIRGTDVDHTLFLVEINRYLENNHFTGILPSFLQSYTYFRFLAQNNLFSCPLPQWCGPWPGNGACAPCVSDTLSSDPIMCCSYHSSSDCTSLVTRSCSVSSCPKIPDLHLCESKSVSSCADCDSTGNDVIGSSQAPHKISIH